MYKADMQKKTNQLRAYDFGTNIGDKIANFIDAVLATLQSIAAGISNFIKDVKDDIVEVLRIINAVICGIINGLISLVATIVQLIALLVDYVVGSLIGMDFEDAKSVDDTILKLERKENIENLLDFLMEKWHQIHEGIIVLFAHLTFDDVKSIVNNILKGYSKYQIAYYVGNFIFEVISGIALTLLTGGAAALQKAATVGKKFIEIIKLVAKEAFETATFGIANIVKGLASFINKFIEVAAQGGEALVKFIKHIFEQVLKKTDDANPDNLRYIPDETTQGKKKYNRQKEVEREKADGGKEKKHLSGTDELGSTPATKKQIDEVKNKIAVIAKKTKSLKCKIKVATKDTDAYYYLKKKNKTAYFDPQKLPPEIWHKEGASNYVINHEYFHYEEFCIIGKEAFTKGDFGNPIEQAINDIKREKYVAEKLWENAENIGLTLAEKLHIKKYFFDIFTEKMKKKLDLQIDFIPSFKK